MALSTVYKIKYTKGRSTTTKNILFCKKQVNKTRGSIDRGVEPTS